MPYPKRLSSWISSTFPVSDFTADGRRRCFASRPLVIANTKTWATERLNHIILSVRGESQPLNRWCRNVSTISGISVLPPWRLETIGGHCCWSLKWSLTDWQIIVAMRAISVMTPTQQSNFPLQVKANQDKFISFTIVWINHYLVGFCLNHVQCVLRCLLVSR